MPFYSLPTGASPVLAGDGPPTGGIGNVGDLFLDRTGKALYGPKEAGGWPTGSPISLQTTGPTGPSVTGPQGPASTVTGPSGPQGQAGPTGATGERGSTGAASSITGPTGPANVLSIGAVSAGAVAAASLAGPPGAQSLSLTLPIGPTGSAGATGPAGAAPQLAIGNVDNASPAAASFTSLGGGSYLLNVSIPPGPTGAGATGPSGVLEYYASASAPTPTRDGAVWLDTDDGRYYTRYSGLWVEIGVQGERGPTGAASTVTGPSGATGAQGGFNVTQSINARTQSYTLTADDAGKLVTMATGSGSLMLTVPATGSAALPIGTHVDLARLGAATVTVTGASGVTINATPGKKLRAQYSTATAIHYEANVWLLAGDLSE